MLDVSDDIYLSLGNPKKKYWDHSFSSRGGVVSMTVTLVCIAMHRKSCKLEQNSTKKFSDKMTPYSFGWHFSILNVIFLCKTPRWLFIYPIRYTLASTNRMIAYNMKKKYFLVKHNMYSRNIDIKSSKTATVNWLRFLVFKCSSFLASITSRSMLRVWYGTIRFIAYLIPCYSFLGVLQPPTTARRIGGFFFSIKYSFEMVSIWLYFKWNDSSENLNNVIIWYACAVDDKVKKCWRKIAERRFFLIIYACT